MAMPRNLLPLDRFATHVDVDTGGEVIVRGALVSNHDGSTIDAAMTISPGGTDVDGLIDFEAGGFYVTSRDPVLHEVHAIATGKGGAACATLGVTAPCLPLRYVEQAHARLMTTDDWASSLKGGLTLEVIAPAASEVVAEEAWLHAGDIAGGGAVASLVFGAFVWLRARRRFAASPAGRLRAMAEHVTKKLDGADAVLAAPLRPALASASQAIRKRRLDPTTPEGKRVLDVLERVERRLDEAHAQATADEERHLADGLVAEMDAAIEASEEVSEPPQRPVHAR
jgi:hypothetical protein